MPQTSTGRREESCINCEVVVSGHDDCLCTMALTMFFDQHFLEYGQDKEMKYKMYLDMNIIYRYENVKPPPPPPIILHIKVVVVLSTTSHA